MRCIPPLHVLEFGKYTMSFPYRKALYEFAPYYTTEEVVGSYLGYNPNFPSEEDWTNEQCEDEEDDSDDDSEEDDDSDDSDGEDSL